jgi:hypothetical protein
VVLRPNHWQTIDLCFEAQPKNMRSSSPCVRCRLHTAPPDLLIAWPLSTRPMWPSRSSAPGLLLLPQSSSLHTMPHLPHAHHETRKHDSPNEQRIKVKQPNRPGFEFKPHQVNDSSQSNQGTDHLLSHTVILIMPCCILFKDLILLSCLFLGLGWFFYVIKALSSWSWENNCRALRRGGGFYRKRLRVIHSTSIV